MVYVRLIMVNSNRLAGSKAFAENAAWKFVKQEKPNFSLSTIAPTLVFGPIVSLRQERRFWWLLTSQVPGLHSVESLNISNQLIRAVTTGAAKEKIPGVG